MKSKAAISKSVQTLLLLTLMATGVRADSFDRIKSRLAEADCVRFSFSSIVYSDIFQTSDTLPGEAALGRDGKYLIRLGGDYYRNDLNEIWSYSTDNNQLVVEAAIPESDPTDQFIFITRLDELYISTIIESDSLYRLTHRSDMSADFPDSLIVTIGGKEKQIVEMKYKDFNGERNQIVILKTEYPGGCNDSLYDLVVPDSTDVVHLR